MFSCNVRAIDQQHKDEAIRTLNKFGIKAIDVNFRELYVEYDDTNKELDAIFIHVLRNVAIGYTYSDGTYNAEY